MVPRLVATSATIIPCGSNTPTNPLSIPVQSNQTTDEGMSLILQLGTTSVGYTPTLTTANVSSGSVSRREVSLRPQQSPTTSGQQPTSVAKHRLPMQINRQAPQVNRTTALHGQQHTTMPVRNISALARHISQPQAHPSASTSKTAAQQSAPSPVASRVLASPVKDSTLDDDLLEGVVEKRPKYNKNLPLNFQILQYIMQDHNYGAPPPPVPSSPPKPMVNGFASANGLTRSQPPTSQQTQNYSSSIFNTSRASKNAQQPSTPSTFSNTTMSNIFGIGTRGPAPAEESDVESSDGEREADPQSEETETAPEGEDNEDDSVTRCICEMQHDDGYMICCDKCLVWQHVDCMGVDRNNVPDEYLCEKCQPRRIDKQKAIALQLRKKRELLDTSDSSSDTSGSPKVPVRKGNAPGNNRRRNEPAQRKNSGGGSAKQRRESAKEQATPRQNNRQAPKKKQTEKKPPARRKSSQSGVNTSPPIPEKHSPVEKKPLTQTPSAPVEQLRQWIDSYEEAVTNHYSPELRARIASIKVNGIHSDFKLPTNLTTTPKCRVSLLPSGIKILVACVSISGNQPLLELRGKYMLCGSGPSNRPPRIATPAPGPHIFHYKLPRDTTEVCVDARTYGNDARFVRRSCKPNAEMRHCIEKGALHLYLVTTKAIDKNTEVTLGMAPGLTCVLCGEGCASAVPLSTSDNHKSLNGLISPTTTNNNNNNTQMSDKRRRGRRRTMSENLSPPKTSAKTTPKPPPKSQPPNRALPTPKPTSKIVPSVRVPTPPPRVPTPPPEPVVERTPTPPPTPPPVARSPSPPPAPTTRSAASSAVRKGPSTPKKEPPTETISLTRQQKKEAADKKNKMTREERKMEAIMKAFERMEKDMARKQEAQARQTHRKDSSESDSKEKPESKEKEVASEKEETSTSSRISQRKRKFSTARRKGRNRSQSIPQPSLRPRRTLRRSQPTRGESPDSAESSDESPVRQRGKTSAPSTPQKTPPTTPNKQESTASTESSKKNFESPSPQEKLENSPETPMSQTAMLIAAAVGPLAPGFKFPMTKKGLINSWLKSPESSPPAIPEEAPITRGQSFNAKKRWLRQAISEECDSPNSRQEASSSPTEHSAPPKKRRLARESVSEDISAFTPPSTPTHTAEALNQMTDEEDSVSSPQDSVKPTAEGQDDVCGSSQESEGPDSPANTTLKPKKEIKNEEEGTEESEEECSVKDVKAASIKEEDKKHSLEKKSGEGGVKHVTIKDDPDLKEEKAGVTSPEKKDNKKPGTAASSTSATKRKLSISEYRQRKQQGPGTVGQKSPGKPDRPSSPTTSATSSMSSSSSEDEDETPNTVIAKSLMLEAALDTTLAKKPLFDSAPTLVERQRENLTQRLKREFGLFLSDDEESDKAKKQGSGEPVNKGKEKDSTKKKSLLPPPPPPAEPPQYQTMFFPGVGHPVYNTPYPPAPPYTNPPAFTYGQMPH